MSDVSPNCVRGRGGIEETSYQCQFQLWLYGIAWHSWSFSSSNNICPHSTSVNSLRAPRVLKPDDISINDFEPRDVKNRIFMTH
jgi:hypothetical protein